MKIPRSAVASVVLSVLECSCLRSAVKFLDHKTVVKCTCVHRPDARCKSRNFVVTIGAPNFRERQFIDLCVKAGEPFPVKKLQFKEWKKARKS